MTVPSSPTKCVVVPAATLTNTSNDTTSTSTSTTTNSKSNIPKKHAHPSSLRTSVISNITISEQDFLSDDDDNLEQFLDWNESAQEMDLPPALPSRPLPISRETTMDTISSNTSLKRISETSESTQSTQPTSNTTSMRRLSLTDRFNISTAAGMMLPLKPLTMPLRQISQGPGRAERLNAKSDDEEQDEDGDEDKGGKDESSSIVCSTSLPNFLSIMPPPKPTRQVSQGREGTDGLNAITDDDDDEEEQYGDQGDKDEASSISLSTSLPNSLSIMPPPKPTRQRTQEFAPGGLAVNEASS